MAASSSDAQPAAGGDGESDEERQRRGERERVLWQQIADTPGLFSIVMPFLPIHLLMQLQLPPLTWQNAARKQHHLTISAADENERSFWQRTTTDLVKEWATYLTKLTCVVLCYPLGFPMWCLDVFVAVIEGHIAGRRAANMDGGTLQTISIEEGVRLTDTARRTVARIDPPLPPPLDPPPTLHALTTITGLTLYHEMLADRRWRMPSLPIVRQGEWGFDSLRLGQIISSSRSLRRVDGSFRGDGWARVFEGVPEAPAGQRGGPLSNLESIGTILVEGDYPAGIDRQFVARLEAVLVARGCRQLLKQLHVRFAAYDVLRDILPVLLDRRYVPVLLALDHLVATCCRQDTELTLTAKGNLEFDLSIFYHTDFPTHPSPSFKTMIQQLARQATSVHYFFTQDGLTDPHTNPSQSAIDIASSLSFDKVKTVSIKNTPGFDPPANTPSPHPSIITHLQPFPKASRLDVKSKLGGAAARLLADRMPKEVERADIQEALGGEEKVGVLTALGREREVRDVRMGQVDIDQLEQLLMGAADRLPTIRELDFTMTPSSAPTSHR
ncbi:unnamed protein product [Vitrella brassicaformis CCMP3155]|uniref:Uncharacterized protein n=1 Tax=Vitrella brassicaformis (strain CCMP3155) TaxID=1169540 RepID=A0A0G4FWT4_VITBC|nr:unnamed protein product [Vitrella brassicaformis CCMP3155]|eukprot:CEM19607.1 unnamed protein product [Vitrella brassicaformis CCMP3155]